MLEKEFRSKIVAVLKPLRAFAVENDVHDGTPDVCCLAGWIELKVATSPARPTTRVDVGLRPAQAVWLQGWRRQGGRAWGMILLDDTNVLLHDGMWASENYDRATLNDLKVNALFISKLLAPTFNSYLMQELMRPMRRPT